ncbi:hypothetical protein H0A64_08580 [Alcaligenaceae bacterium]|nr:hypothetical protein [Alcaligenaceae bacterium]
MDTAEHGLAKEDVRKYLQRICEEAGDMMRAYDPQLLLEWTDTNLAAGAAFQVDLRIQKDGVHTGSVAMTLEKGDILRLGGIFGTLAGKGTIADYSLDVTIKDVVSHGSEATTVKVTWHEHIVYQAPSAPEDDAANHIVADIEADCCHLLLREDGRLAIGLTLCSGDARLSMAG